MGPTQTYHAIGLTRTGTFVTLPLMLSPIPLCRAAAFGWIGHHSCCGGQMGRQQQQQQQQVMAAVLELWEMLWALG
jgi:hypothetical protein